MDIKHVKFIMPVFSKVDETINIVICKRTLSKMNVFQSSNGNDVQQEEHEQLRSDSNINLMDYV